MNDLFAEINMKKFNYHKIKIYSTLNLNLNIMCNSTQ